MTVFYRDSFVEELTVDPFSRHFRYGAGVFETILFDGISICSLDFHLERLHSSTAFFGYRSYSFDYRGVIFRLLENNGLLNGQARVNICHLMEKTDEYSVFISAVPYEPPAEDKIFDLCVYPNVHDTYMSRHKTMNYLHFLSAKKYAADRGYDDALLVDSFGNVLETSASATVFCADGKYFVPESENRLPSAALEKFEEHHKTEKKNIKVSSISKYEILVMNSLMGVRKARIR